MTTCLSRSKRAARAAVLVLTVLLAFGPGPATAGPAEKGLPFYDAGKYADALRLWQPLAAAGDTDAQYYIGIAYLEGKGVARDVGLARTWFRMSAKGGNLAARFALGKLAFEVDHDLDAARKWLEPVAERGVKAAQDLLDEIGVAEGASELRKSLIRDTAKDVLAECARRKKAGEPPPANGFCPSQ